MAADVVPIIQATLAPIFLVSGAAIFLNFTQARLFRVIDRLRALGAELKEEKDPDRRGELLWQRTRHLRRALLLRNAILFGTLVIALTIATAFLLLVSDAFIGLDPGLWPIALFALGLVSFGVALILVVVDAFLSVATALRADREFLDGVLPHER